MSSDDSALYLMQPPEGFVRDLNQPHQAAPLVVVAVIFLPLATISMVVRVYTRIALVHKFSFDDYLMTLAWIFDVLLVGFTLNMLNYGMGKHLWNVPISPDLYPRFNLNNMLAAIFFCAATGFAKGSILLFYLRIFPITAAKILVWIAFVFIIGYSTASVIVNIVACTPIQSSWVLEYVAEAKCINRPLFYLAQAGLGIAADIITVAIPIPWLRTLQLPKKQKISVAVLLTMGAFVCVVSVIRLQSLNVLLNDADLTHNTVMALMWCVLELNLSIIGGSIATIKPFLRMLLPRIFGTSRGKSTEDGIYLHPASRSLGYQSRASRGIKLDDSVKGASSAAAGYSTGSEELIADRPFDKPRAS